MSCPPTHSTLGVTCVGWGTTEGKDIQKKTHAHAHMHKHAGTLIHTHTHTHTHTHRHTDTHTRARVVVSSPVWDLGQDINLAKTI